MSDEKSYHVGQAAGALNEPDAVAVVESPFCGSLRSKKFFMTDGLATDEPLPRQHRALLVPRDAVGRRPGRRSRAPGALRARQDLLQFRAEGLTKDGRGLTKGRRS